MSYSELIEEHEVLRAQLEAAYAAKVWDTEKIDRIANRIIEVEIALDRRVRIHVDGHAAGPAVSA